MQGSKSEVAGFCDTQRRLNGFQVSHFADQHHVWIFTKCSAQCVTKAFRISMQFTLVDHAVLVHVDEFDRVLNRQDMVVTLGVDFVDHRREGRGLTRARRAGDKNQTRGFSHSLATTGGNPS